MLKRIALSTCVLLVVVGSSYAQSLRIERIIDGDTFELSDGRVVDLIGVNAPGIGDSRDCPVNEEISDPEREHILDELARKHARTWLKGQVVSLEFDSRMPRVTSRGTTLAYLFVTVGGRRLAMANELMIADGVAQACLGEDYRLRPKFLLSQKNARDRRIGLWSPDRQHHFPGAGAKIGCECQSFVSHEEALEFFHEEGGPAYDPFLLDTDRDGVPCEALAP